MVLKPHQQRVVEEKNELDARLSRLNEFIKGPFFETVADDEASRLRRQHALMAQLSTVLGERIAAF